MSCFARVDLLASYWRGTLASQGQTGRMVDFLQRYIPQEHEAYRVAVAMWRHVLMHTSEPRYLEDRRAGQQYRWLLHWGEPHLTRDQHFIFQVGPSYRILNLGLFHLIPDLMLRVVGYLEDLAESAPLQTNYWTVRDALKVRPL